MKTDRRRVLGGAAATAALGSGPAFGQASYRTRKSAHRLTESSPDVVTFARGVAMMKQHPGHMSWRYQTDLHAQWAHHGDSYFLPWHRLQIFYLERIIGHLTRIDNFALPYWDIQQSPRMPSWLANMNALRDPTRERGPNYDYRVARNLEEAAKRGLTADLFSGGFNDILGGPDGSGGPRDQRTAGKVEQSGHNWIHTQVGGNMRRTETAAADPVFWLHHCNVDRVWESWQRQAQRSYPQPWRDTPLPARQPPGSPPGAPRLVTPFAAPGGIVRKAWTPSETLTTRSLGYSYDETYNRRVFLVGPGPAPAGSTVYTLSVRAEPGQSSLRLVLPREVVAHLRSAGDTSLIEGTGRVSYVANALLLDRSLDVTVTSGKQDPLWLESSPTFFHVADAAEGRHHSDYAIGFRFGREILEFVRQGRDPVVIAAAAADLDPAARRAPAQALELQLTLTVTETRSPTSP